VSVEALPPLDQECFFIAPIGAEGTDVRNRSDGILEYIVDPAAAAVELTTIRADKIAKPGEITRQVIEHVVGARAAVVDLTGANPNVYYEMAVRHTAQLPTVLIAQDGEVLPFDIAQMRTIFFDHTNLKSAGECKDQITQYLVEALSGEVDSPISSSVRVQHLEQGSPQDRVLAQIVDGLAELRSDIADIEISARREENGPDEVPVHVEAIEDLAKALVDVAQNDMRVRDLLPRLEMPVTYMLRRVHERRPALSRRYESISELMDAFETEVREPMRVSQVPERPAKASKGKSKA
jgi:hypothetical protein